MLEQLFGRRKKDENTQLMLSQFPNAVGQYGYDAWGFNIKVIEQYISIGKFLYDKYFKVEVRGWENVPKEGRCFIIANHTGQLPIDAVLLGYALVINPIAPRAPKGMFERFIPTVPFFSMWATQVGGAVGDTENCEKMLANEEAVMVFPEGAKGISKPSSKKYQLQHFGTGFMHLAKKHHTPIIPVGIAGCEEIMYNFGNIDFLEKLLRWPAFPMLLPIVFPSKVVINIGKPMHFDSNIERESDLYREVDIVKEEIHRLTMEALEIRNGKH